MKVPQRGHKYLPSALEFASETLSRRSVLLNCVVTVLAGCVPRDLTQVSPTSPHRLQDYHEMYGALTDNGVTIPPAPLFKLRPEFYRQEVEDPTGAKPGTIVVDTSRHFLYLVQDGGQALRYGVGLGRAGFSWSGEAIIARKAEWPRWRPPAEMIVRLPNLERYRSHYDAVSGQWMGGMEPGIANPLGARALYLYAGGKDTLYRIHGTPEWWTIGTNVSSGCVRLLNQDVIDLYERVSQGATVIVTAALPVSTGAQRVTPAGLPPK